MPEERECQPFQQGPADKTQGSSLMAAGGKHLNSRNQWQCPVHKASASLSPKEELLITMVKVARKLNCLLFIRFLMLFPPQAVCVCIFIHTPTYPLTLPAWAGAMKVSENPGPQLPSCGWWGLLWLRHAGEKLCCTQTSLQKYEWVKAALTGVLKALSCQGYQHGTAHLKREFSSSKLHRNTWKHTVRS